MPRFSQLICPATGRVCPHPDVCRKEIDFRCMIDLRDIVDVLAIADIREIPALLAAASRLRRC